MLNRRPRGPLCWVMAFFTASYQHLLWTPNSIGVPEGPFGRMWLSLPHLVYNSNSNSNWNSNSLTSVLTELYNSSMPTQSPTRSPTRSLKSHVWSSSSRNNCHAVHRSLSSGASVYECIMGFTLSHFISQIHPRNLFRLLATGICHFLPVHHFVMACLLGPKVKIQQFEFRVFLLLDQLPHQGWRTQSALLFTHSWRENNWIHTFPKGISAMWNAISLVQYLNLCRCVHFLRR